MTKPKSTKMHMLATLHALWKHTDANHHMSISQLNEYLDPYGLDCTNRALLATVRVMRAYGLDVQKGHQSVWITNRPLPDHGLKRLIFAVSSNPLLSIEQQTEILQSLTPFVTVYQEPILRGVIDTVPDIPADDRLFQVFGVIQEAIQTGKCVSYTIDYGKFNKETPNVVSTRQRSSLFAPKCLYHAKGALYMVGYNSSDHRASAVNLKDIATIQLSFRHNNPKEFYVQERLRDIVPEELVPGERREVIYEGPVLFQCRVQYTTELYNRFGPPNGPVIKDKRCHTKYPVSHATVTSETIFWLSQVCGYGIRILGPESLTAAVRDYYARQTNLLFTPLPFRKPKT